MRLLGGCDNYEVLVWNEGSQLWECQSPSSIGGVVSGSGVSGFVSYYIDTFEQSGTSNFFWDIADSRLGIGTSDPDYTLHVNGSGLIGTILLSDSGNTIGIETDTNLINLSNNLVTIDGNLTTSGYITAASAVNTINGLVINSGNITTGVWQGSTITVPYGGTGATTLTDHGVLVGSGVGAITAVEPGTDGQVFLGISGDDPIFRSLGGDIASISVAGTGPALVTLANTTVVAGSYGSQIVIPQITVDSKGRITDVTPVDISLSLILPGMEGQMIYSDNGTWTAFSDLFWDDTNKYLGIGTTTPTQKLDVSGNIRVSGAYFDSSNSAGNSGYIMTSTSAGTQWVDMSNVLLPTGTEGQLLYNDNGTWTPFSGMYWNDTNNYLGLGTTNPS